MSGLVNKAKEVIHNVTHHDDKTHTNTAGMTSGAPEGIAGPHGSRVANAADPRVDSDLDNRAQYGTGLTGSTTTTGTGVGTHSSTNVGPHSSNIANKLDPRVDSDLDGGRHAGLNQTTGTHTTHTTKTGTGFDGTSTGSTNAGPHSSNLMNKVDPRVDSDLDGGRHAGLNQTTHPSTGHPSTTGATAPGAGVGNTTLGSTNADPHNSNLLNKLDPRVDSDLDASRNAGLNQTTRP